MERNGWILQLDKGYTIKKMRKIIITCTSKNKLDGSDMECLQ